MNNGFEEKPNSNEPDYEVHGTSEAARRAIESSVRGYLTMSGEQDGFSDEEMDFRRKLESFVGTTMDSGLRPHQLGYDRTGLVGTIEERTPTEKPRLAVYYMFMANHPRFFNKTYKRMLAEALGLLPFNETELMWELDDYAAEKGWRSLAEMVGSSGDK